MLALVLRCFGTRWKLFLIPKQLQRFMYVQGLIKLSIFISIKVFTFIVKQKLSTGLLDIGILSQVLGNKYHSKLLEIIDAR
jgi:hypothetical protein